MTSLRRMLSLSSSPVADDGDTEVGRRTDRERTPLLEGDDGGNNYSGENGSATGTGIASATDTLFSLSREESMVDPGIVASRRNLTTFAGVFSPVALSMFSTALFLRLGFVLGQSGLILTLLQLGLAYLILYLTILSICAISTNGQVQGGGAYYMISRALGPEFGGSIGLLFFLANVFSCALYVSGFVEGLIDNFGPGGTFVGSSGGLAAGNRWWTYLYCTVVLALCLLVCFIGSTMFARTSVFIFMIVTGVIVTVVVSMFAVGERCVPYPDTNPRLHPVPNDTNITECANYTGFSLQTFMDNMYDRYTVDYITGKNMNFSVVFAILFSSVTGIMNGANMSGELKNPSKSIPKGTLGATTFALGVYVILTFLTSFTCERDLLVNNYIFLQPINLWPPFIVIGIFATTLSAALGNLIGASRILEALANDELFWMILKPAKFATRGHNPIGAVLISWFLVQLVLLIGSLNAIAPVTSSFFLLSYASTNLACLALDLASAPNFRPTFKYFTSHTSFLGLLGCMIMCFIINPIYASIALVVCMLLVITLHLRVYPESWGSISQALIFHQVRKYLLLLDSRKDHVKYWRPQMLLLVNNPRSCSVLIDFINDIKKGGLYVLGHVKVGDFDDMPTDPCQVDMLNWLGLVDSLKVKAFVELTIADSVRDGMNHLVRVSGLGGMKPNTICLGFYDSSQPDDLLSVQLDRKQRRSFRRAQNPGENDDMTSRFPEPRDNGAEKPLSVNEYVHMIADIFKMNKNVCLFRYFEQLDKQAIFNSKQPRYIDVWPVNFFQPQTSHYFDNTCLFLLQLACILHMVPGWKSHTILRVFLCVEMQTSDVTRIETKLRQILTDLRILGQVKIVTWEHVTRHIGVAASATRDGVVLPQEYLVALNELVKSESRNTAMVFTYLPKVPLSEDAWGMYLDQLSVITADLPPTVLVHGVHTVVSTTL